MPADLSHLPACVCVFAGEEVREASNHLLLTSAATL